MSLRLLVAGLVPRVVAAGVAIALQERSGSASEAARTPRYAGSVPPGGFVLPRFALRDNEGRLLRSSDLRGRAVALTFLDAQCRESCPIIAAQIGRTFAGMQPKLRSRVVAVALSTDPAEDTGPAVRAFLRRTHAEGRLRYLTGPKAELERLYRAFLILPSERSGSDSVHSAPVRIYDPRGRWVSTLHPGVDLTGRNLVHDLVAALRV